MIWKLVKMEFKSCYQKIGVALLGSFIIGFLLFFSANSNMGDFTTTALLTFLWSIAIMAILILFVYNVITSFTKRIFSREGYLTLTLPVTSFQLILSKLLVQLIWLVLIFMSMIVLVFLVGLTFNVSIGNMFDAMGYVIKDFFEDPTAWAALFNGVISVIFSIGAVWFFITLMNTKIIRNRRTLVAVIAFVAFNIVFSNVLQAIYSNVFPGYYNYSTVYSVISFGSIFTVYDWQLYYFVDGLIHCVFALLFYFGITYLLDNHIELE